LPVAVNVAGLVLPRLLIIAEKLVISGKRGLSLYPYKRGVGKVDASIITSSKGLHPIAVPHMRHSRKSGTKFNWIEFTRHIPVTRPTGHHKKRDVQNRIHRF
jgi:hypothetical protein